MPFDIPDSWEWVRLQTVCTKLVDGDHNPPKGEVNQNDYIMASSTNINQDRLVDLEKVRYLSAETFLKENERTSATIHLPVHRLDPEGQVCPEQPSTKKGNAYPFHWYTFPSLGSLLYTVCLPQMVSSIICRNIQSCLLLFYKDAITLAAIGYPASTVTAIAAAISAAPYFTICEVLAQPEPMATATFG